VLAKLAELRIAPLLGTVRGRPARDLRAFARMAVKLGDALIASKGEVAAIDINPVMLFETGALALDALVEVAPTTKAAKTPGL
jgi:acetate---CoA ligase (ADP-forming)